MEYEFSVIFSAESFEEAEEIMEKAITAICGGSGDGEDHVCEFADWAARGPSRVFEGDEYL